MKIYGFRQFDSHSKDSAVPSLRVSPRRLGLPAICCEGEPGCCGVSWSDSMSRVRIEPPPNALHRYANGSPVSPQVLRTMQAETRTLLNLPEDYPLPPGTDVGLLHVKSVTRFPLDVEWPEIQGIVVKLEFLLALEVLKLTGWQPSPVVLEKFPGKSSPPLLTELLVSDRAGQPICRELKALEDLVNAEQDAYTHFVPTRIHAD